MSQRIWKLEVGFHSWSFASLPLEKALRHIRDVGFTEVEITANELHLDPRLFSRSKLPHLKKLLKDLSLHPNSVHTPIDGVDLATPHPEGKKKTMDLLVDTLKYCRAIECPLMVVHPNGTEVLKKNSIQALKELAIKAEDLGVKVALENMIDRGDRTFGSRVTDLREIIEEVGSSFLGICFDIGHANLSHANLGEEITKVGEYLWTLHVHDNDGKEDRHWPPGDGNIDWSEIISGLRKVNYRGIFMMEIWERGNPDELAKRCLQRATEILGLHPTQKKT